MFSPACLCVCVCVIVGGGAGSFSITIELREADVCGAGAQSRARGHPYMEQDIHLKALTLMNQQGTVWGEGGLIGSDPRDRWGEEIKMKRDAASLISSL